MLQFSYITLVNEPNYDDDKIPLQFFEFLCLKYLQCQWWQINFERLVGYLIIETINLLYMKFRFQ